MLDRGRKLRLCAREGVPEYWIINLAENCIEVRRNPAAEEFGDARIYHRGESIPTGPGAGPVAVSDLLP